MKKFILNEEKYETICSCHKKILQLTSNKNLTQEQIKEIYALADLAYEYGVSMENRLIKYKKAIFKLNKLFKKAVDNLTTNTILKALINLNKSLGFDPYTNNGVFIRGKHLK
jgi:hypothetical protein